ncbi:MAG: Uma2 family endonuclease [Anaerolineales bacterium]|nr:Uma2 family endonuclease [Anaerolineales bacterium]
MSLLDELTHEPSWEIVRLFPRQGLWSEEEYLRLQTNRLVELAGGCIEVLARPSRLHQELVIYLCMLLRQVMQQHGLGGSALLAPFSIRLGSSKFRQPDIIYMLPENQSREHETFWDEADLMMEILSPDDPARDIVTKRREYADAGILEYWIVDPNQKEIAVMRLQDGQYEVSQVVGHGAQARSHLLPQFVVDVDLMGQAAGQH